MSGIGQSLYIPEHPMARKLRPPPSDSSLFLGTFLAYVRS
jgi:hypothetical protein